MSRFMGWVGGTHMMRYHAHYDTSGMGHVCQQRYKNFPFQGGDHFLASASSNRRPYNAQNLRVCAVRSPATTYDQLARPVLSDHDWGLDQRISRFIWHIVTFGSQYRIITPVRR